MIREHVEVVHFTDLCQQSPKPLWDTGHFICAPDYVETLKHAPCHVLYSVRGVKFNNGTVYATDMEGHAVAYAATTGAKLFALAPLAFFAFPTHSCGHSQVGTVMRRTSCAV